MLCRKTTLAMLLLGLAGAAQADLLLVYSVQRHGARNVLNKTATLKETDANGGPTLLPQGQRQAYDAGLNFRDRYLNSLACANGLSCLDASLADSEPEYGVVGSADGIFNNFNTLLRSSSLDRAIMTARSFLDAVFPPINQPTDTTYLPDRQQVVPVYSQAADGDAIIRGYTACPAYDNRLLEWYNSPEFQEKEAESQAFRDAVATQAATIGVKLNTSLTEWWNVFDGFNVYRTYNVGNEMPPVDNETFAEMQELAYWLETSKMRSNLTGNLLGGALLADLLEFLDRAVTVISANVLPNIYYKLVHLSGHYNTQLGVLGALEIDQDPAAADVTWFSKIPSLAALMAFELHGDTSGDQSPQDLAVRLVMQDGPKADYVTIPLPCASPGDSAEVLAGAGSCSFDSFKALAAPKALNTLDDWCDACENDSWTACQLLAATRALNTSTDAAGTDSGSSDDSGTGLSSGAVAGIAVGCALAGAVLAVLVTTVYGRRARAKMARDQLMSVHGSLPRTV